MQRITIHLFGRAPSLPGAALAVLIAVLASGGLMGCPFSTAGLATVAGLMLAKRMAPCALALSEA